MEKGEPEVCRYVITQATTLGEGVHCSVMLLLCSMLFQTNGPLRPRWGHSVTAFSLTSELTEVTTFGGSADTWTGMSWLHSKLAHTTIHQFCKSLCRVYYFCSVLIEK